MRRLPDDLQLVELGPPKAISSDLSWANQRTTDIFGNVSRSSLFLLARVLSNDIREVRCRRARFSRLDSSSKCFSNNGWNFKGGFMATTIAVGTMKVAQISKPGAGFEIVEREIPEPGAGEVRIRVQAFGVCPSDIFVKEGLWPGIQYPRVPGHEVAGLVDEIGPEGTG